MKVYPLQINGVFVPDVEIRMQNILDAWEGTPHMDGQQAKGKGVDCVRFVAAVLDEMAGTKTKIQHLPRDIALHSRSSAVAGMRLFITQFKGRKLEPTEQVQPGDVLVTGPASGGPGHAIIVGPDGRLWQSSTKKVMKSGWEVLSLPLYVLKCIMRPDKREWVQ